MKNIFAERLESLRGAKTQKEFAQFLGIPLTTYTNWLAGLRSPGIDAVRKICTQTGVSADWLLGLSDAAGALASGERERLEARVSELEGALHDAEVSIRTLRETILEGNAAPSSFPLSSLRPASPSRRHPAP